MQAELDHPVDGVLAAVAARRLRAGVHRQMDLAAGGQQLLGDLPAGLAGPRDPDGTVRQPAGVAVGIGVQLQDMPRQP
nr:hypothetical protein [Arthrobacter sp. U41]